MSKAFGGGSPFGVQLKSKKTVRTNETVQAPFGVSLKKFKTTQDSSDSAGSIKLKGFQKASASSSQSSSSQEVGSVNASQTGIK